MAERANRDCTERKWRVRYSELVEVEEQRGVQGLNIGGRYKWSGGYDIRDL
jgi:hypothetical protein